LFIFVFMRWYRAWTCFIW